MKRYIYKIILFFALILAIDFVIGVIGDYFQANAKNGPTKTLNDLLMNDYHDVIILGSSRAHHHYDTPFLSDTLGLDVYNAGYDGNGVILAYGLLEMILERYSPKLVIFDVEPSFDIFVYENDNMNKRYISLLKPYYRNDKVGDIIKDVSLEDWYKVHFGLLRYNSTFIKLLADYILPREVYLAGYQPLDGVYTDEVNTKETTELTIDSFKLGYIDKLIDLSISSNVPIAFVASPRYGVTSSSIFQPVKDICAKRNVQFFDYYVDKDFLEHKEWFNEPMHLNKEGARIFSNRLIAVFLLLLNDNG